MLLSQPRMSDHRVVVSSVHEYHVLHSGFREGFARKARLGAEAPILDALMQDIYK